MLITAKGLEYEFVPISTSSISVTDSLYMPKVGSFSGPFDITFGVYTINLVEMLQRNEAESCNKLTLEKTGGTIKNGQTTDFGDNIGHTRNKTKMKTAQPKRVLLILSSPVKIFPLIHKPSQAI